MHLFQLNNIETSPMIRYSNHGQVLHMTVTTSHYSYWKWTVRNKNGKVSKVAEVSPILQSKTCIWILHCCLKLQLSGFPYYSLTTPACNTPWVPHSTTWDTQHSCSVGRAPGPRFRFLSSILSPFTPCRSYVGSGKWFQSESSRWID